MNAVLFGLKRAFHGTLRVSRSTLKNCGLTAARFDLLYALHKRPLRGIRQAFGDRATLHYPWHPDD